MAKPRVFVSSTYYDLKYIRTALEQFIESLGYEAVLYESGDIPFSHSDPLDHSCYREIGTCHILVLIIGGRYGSAASMEESEAVTKERITLSNSVTRKEYETARELNIPIYTFVEGNVLSEYRTYKRNKGVKLNYAHVDHIGVFELIEAIYSETTNNLLRDFSGASDIISWLRDQWAGRFAEFLSSQSRSVSVANIQSEVDKLTAVSAALMKYSEAIIRNTARNEEESETLIKQTEQATNEKLLEIALKKSMIMGILLRKEALTVDKLIELISKAQTVTELHHAIRSAAPGQSAFSVHSWKYDLPQVNEIRRLLKLSHFTLGEDEEAKFPIPGKSA